MALNLGECFVYISRDNPLEMTVDCQTAAQYAMINRTVISRLSPIRIIVYIKVNTLSGDLWAKRTNYGLMRGN